MAEFKVASSSQINDEIRRLHRVAKLRGDGDRYLDALKSLHQSLESMPSSLGEPTFRFAHLELLNFVAVRIPIAIEYCLDEERKIVYLRRINLLGD